jgi:hypothetical protein
MSNRGASIGSALLVAGALLVAEAIVSHRHQLVWAAVGSAAIIAGAASLWTTRRDWPSHHEIGRLGRRWRPFLAAAVVYLIAFAVIAPAPAGDQAHYELESIGLAYDQTRDMTANYSDRSRYELVFKNFAFKQEANGSYVGEANRYKSGGELVLPENVGLPLLLTPAVPWAKIGKLPGQKNGRWPWNVEIIFFAALAAQLLYRMLTRVRPNRPRLVAAVWASIVFSPPMVIYASSVYPEIPAALLALIAVNSLSQPPTRRTLLVGGCASALMPWLQVRYLPIAALLVLGLAVRQLAAVPRGERLIGAQVRSVAWTIAPFLLSLLVMGIAFEHWYGSPWPTAPYRLPQTRVFTPHTLSASWVALAGAFWGTARGWLPYAPVAILALASIGYTLRRYRAWTLFGLLVAGVYLLNLTIQGSSPGFSFAGRFEVILMPFAALPLVVATADVSTVRRVFWPLAALTLYLSFAIVLEPPPVVVALHNAPLGPPSGAVLWKWFVNIWPQVIRTTAASAYPDAPAVLAWGAALLAGCVAGYFVRRPRVPATAAHR